MFVGVDVLAIGRSHDDGQVRAPSKQSFVRLEYVDVSFVLFLACEKPRGQRTLHWSPRPRGKTSLSSSFGVQINGLKNLASSILRHAVPSHASHSSPKPCCGTCLYVVLFLCCLGGNQRGRSALKGVKEVESTSLLLLLDPGSRYVNLLRWFSVGLMMPSTTLFGARMLHAAYVRLGNSKRRKQPGVSGS